MSKRETLRITEIFHSLQGESRTVGIPTVFVRLTGCPLRCQYCDTAYAFDGGEIMAIEAILEKVEGFRSRFITVTGGEPLAQPNCIPLLAALCDRNYSVSLETGGAMAIDDVDKRVSVVLDIKTPGSAEADKNRFENISRLKPDDQVKFVICDRTDYEWSKAKIEQLDLPSRVTEILLSPSHEQLAAADLADWILQDALPVRMQMQMHKQIWGSVPGK